MLATQLLKTGIAVIGDTQRKMFHKLLWVKDADNHSERMKLIQHIKIQNPDFVLITGDMVTYGHNEADWSYFAEVIGPLGDTPILPVLGNHDYFLFQGPARLQLQKRFPRLSVQSWYVEHWGPLAIVIIDSNKRILKKRWQEQKEWFTQTLESLDKNPSVKGIIVSGHHPPFTNGFLIHPHGPTREDFLPAFYKSKKTMAYLSGHCHAYERFEIESKTFIVTGGGGGPRRTLRIGKFSRFKDQYSGGKLRPFHYLWITSREDGLHFKVYGLEKHQKDMTELEKFTLRWVNE